MLCSRGSGLSPFWSSFRHYMCLQLRWMESLHKALETAQKALAFTLVPTSAAQMFHTEPVLLKCSMINIHPLALHKLFLSTAKI